MLKTLAIIAIVSILTVLILLLSYNNDIQDNNTNNNIDINEEESELMIYFKIGEHKLTVNLVDNSSTQALLELLEDGPITIDMRDYANMEKVGSLPSSLPRNDEPIQAVSGDVILYQGSALVIYYDNNSWNFTRLGRVEGVTSTELKSILGDGSVSVTLSLE